MDELTHAMKSLRADPSDDESLSRIAATWGNELFAADPSFLRVVIDSARATAGQVLECGTGATTLALAAVVPGRVTSVENSWRWRRRVSEALDEADMRTAIRLRWAPLRRFGDITWYSRPPRDRAYSLVVCDGPPGHRGGRYGLLPVMHDHLLPGCTILLDDTEREAERQIAERWSYEFGLGVKFVESAHGLAVMSVPPAGVTSKA